MNGLKFHVVATDLIMGSSLINVWNYYVSWIIGTGTGSGNIEINVCAYTASGRPFGARLGLQFVSLLLRKLHKLNSTKLFLF